MQLRKRAYGSDKLETPDEGSGRAGNPGDDPGDRTADDLSHDPEDGAREIDASRVRRRDRRDIDKWLDRQARSEQYRDLMRALGRLREEPAPASVAGDVVDDVLAYVFSEDTSPSRRRLAAFLKAGGVAALVGAAVAAVLVLSRNPRVVDATRRSGRSVYTTAKKGWDGAVGLVEHAS